MWNFNFFFYNKKMKRILYIGVKALSKTAAEDEKVGGVGGGVVRLCVYLCMGHGLTMEGAGVWVMPILTGTAGPWVRQRGLAGRRLAQLLPAAPCCINPPPALAPPVCPLQYQLSPHTLTLSPTLAVLCPLARCVALFCAC